MREPDNIDQVANLHPDYLGLIFYEASPRFVKNEVQNLDPAVRKTGVFVNASVEGISEKTLQYDLKAIQLHGEESAEFCQELKEQLSAEGRSPELIKVFNVKETFDFKNLKEFENVVDLFLFDTKGINKGGNGITFNWEVLKSYPSPTPFFLSGGIGIEEIPGIKCLYAYFQNKNKEELFYGIDVNSKFETSPGLKDTNQLKIFRDKLFSEA